MTTNDELIEALEDLAKEMHARTSKFECLVRQGKLFLVIGATLVLGIIVALCIVVPLSVSNRKILNTVDRVTDPNGQYVKDSQKRTAGILLELNQEEDCRNRRAMVGLPAPIPGMSCRAQTDVSVYPG
jgi:hypothetical protein